MNLNIKRHKLLEILSIQELNCQTRKDGYDFIGVSYDEIYSKLNVDEFKLLIITSELHQSNEISYHDAGKIDGLCINHPGLSAYSNKKYLNLFWDNIFSISKNIVQVFIPVLSLIIAYVALTTKLDSQKKQNDKELQEVRLLLIEQQKHIKALEYHRETHQNEERK